MYQSGKIYTKVPQNISNGGKIHQMDLKVPKIAIKYTQFSIPKPTKYIKIGIFGLKKTIWQTCFNGSIFNFRRRQSSSFP
jgi:hypothetical protein